jgi:hypothetical protein
MTTITTVFEVPYLCANYNRNIVLVFKVGNSLTHYLGLDGCCLSVMKEKTVDFEKEYEPWEKNTPLQFAERYALVGYARTMIQLTGAAHRVLKAILTNQGLSDVDYPQPQPSKEFIMAKEETGFRKPDGAVAQVHGYLDKKLEQVKAGTVSRKELIEQLVAKGLNESTIVTQCGVWARDNGVQFARPTQADANKKEKRSAAAKTAKVAKKKVAVAA